MLSSCLSYSILNIIKLQLKGSGDQTMDPCYYIRTIIVISSMADIRLRFALNDPQTIILFSHKQRSFKKA